MIEVKRYAPPFPKPDSVVPGNDDDSMCPASADDYGCTREIGHSGDHQACDTRDRMVASWAAES